MDLTREEMIAMAAKTRTQVMNARVSPELLERYPAVVAKRLIPTEAGDSPVYDILPEGGRPQNSRLRQSWPSLRIPSAPSRLKYLPATPKTASCSSSRWSCSADRSTRSTATQRAGAPYTPTAMAAQCSM